MFAMPAAARAPRDFSDSLQRCANEQPDGKANPELSVDRGYLRWRHPSYLGMKLSPVESIVDRLDSIRKNLST